MAKKGEKATGKTLSQTICNKPELAVFSQGFSLFEVLIVLFLISQVFFLALSFIRPKKESFQLVLLKLNQISWLAKNMAQSSQTVVRLHFQGKNDRWLTLLEKCPKRSLPWNFWQLSLTEQEAIWSENANPPSGCQPVGPRLSWQPWVFQSGRCQDNISGNQFFVYVLPDGESHPCELIFVLPSKSNSTTPEMKKVLRLHPLFLKWSLDEANPN